MRSLIAYFIPSLYRQPKVGDRYRHMDGSGDPFSQYLVYTVKDVKDGWVLLSFGALGGTMSVEVCDLLAFYREVKS